MQGREAVKNNIVAIHKVPQDVRLQGQGLFCLCPFDFMKNVCSFPLSI